jgi:hypothetical protein
MGVIVSVNVGLPQDVAWQGRTVRTAVWGDRIVKLSDGPEHMTVAEIDALLYSAEHPFEALRRAVRIPALSLDWQGSMQVLLAAVEAGGTTGNAGLGPGASAPLAWRGFRPVVVVASREESADVRSFELAAEDGSPLPPEA